MAINCALDRIGFINATIALGQRHHNYAWMGVQLYLGIGWLGGALPDWRIRPARRPMDATRERPVSGH